MEEMMREHKLSVVHVIIFRWVQRYAQEDAPAPEDE
jgi:transposase-like protein